ncbi:tRNA lysidine(34) synthetase TilS [Teredinibacter sp. KSP-S5-2]|uniref:tRNA lysidine(34) synthetase TilS n=1 Tax=Teredinibacter sp. KSP-S5-2 TaxID=3034506 RepID=UPI0029350FC3|nr:tRNA lysidine(34) synthetase TilS [Teredinibacter sp. KSP-S5-2]WNO10341.1 tRNA lysidine(34) synthetase TilS [Teredinibacter sp. KSP-S5-2]
MFDKNAILQEIERFSSANGKIWVAYSGGLDSTCLLHMLACSSLANRVHAIHVNHQLSANASTWQNQCVQTAENMGIPIQVEVVEVVDQGKGTESAARVQRYAAFHSVLDSDDILLIAHHQSDMLETLLFRLFRGAGLKGLAAIPKSRACGKGTLFRPLLSVSREELAAYAEQHRLNWVEDESNQSDVYDRNFIRSHVIPIIKTRWPKVEQKAFLTGELLSESESLLSEYGEEDLRICQCREERLGQSIDLTQFEHYGLDRQRHIIRVWTHRCGYSLPDHRQLEQLPSILQAAQDGCPCLSWGQCELRRYQNRLYLLPKVSVASPVGESWTIDWSPLLQPELVLPWGDKLVFQPSGQFPKTDFSLSVSLRQPGLRCRPESRERSQTLKKLLQEHQLEPWLRERVPLVFYQGHLVAVGDLWFCVMDDGGVNNPFLSDWQNSHLSWRLFTKQGITS